MHGPERVHALESLWDGCSLRKANCLAKYEILAPLPPELEVETRSSTVELTVEWETTCGRVFDGPKGPSVSVLRLLAEPGYADPENETVLNSLYRQLTTLTRWNALRQDNPDWQMCSALSEGQEDDAEKLNMIHLADAVENFLETFDNGVHPTIRQDASLNGNFIDGATSGPDASAEDQAGDNAAFSGIHSRTGLDFVDQLWLFCQQASAKDDLVNALSVVFGELEAGKLLPVVSKSNQSSLANLVRDCLRLAAQRQSMDAKEQRESIAATLEFWLDQPLECLVDAGVWKMRRDYMFHLLESNLVSRSQLDPFVDPAMSHEDQITRLQCLQRTLEICCLIRSNVIAIPDETLASVAQSCLKYFGSKIATGDASSGNITELDQAVALEIVLPKYAVGVQRAVSALTSSIEPAIMRVALLPTDPSANVWNVAVFDGSHTPLIYDTRSDFGEEDGHVNAMLVSTRLPEHLMTLSGISRTQ